MATSGVRPALAEIDAVIVEIGVRVDVDSRDRLRSRVVLSAVLGVRDNRASAHTTAGELLAPQGTEEGGSMKYFTATVCALGISVASWLAPGPVSADEPAHKEPSSKTTYIGQKMSGGGSIMNIDAKTRHLTLKMDDGTDVTVHVPDSVKRFDELKKGDHINVDYYESVALSLAKPGETASKGTVTARGAGKLPGGIVAKQVTQTVEISKIEGDKVTVKKPDGTMETIDVTDDAMKTDLAKMKVGDKISATYTEAVAITVSREDKPKQ